MKKTAAHPKPVAGETAAHKRNFVRLEVFSPIGFSSIVIEADKKVRLHPEKKEGVLLNLSGGGVLISTTDRAVEGEYLFMRFNLKGFDSLTNVLGKVKRVEASADGENLVGIEFLSLEHIEDPTVAEAMGRLANHPTEFSQGLSRLVSRFVFQRQVETETD